MSKVIFIDTSGFYSLLVKTDLNHRKAKEILQQSARNRQQFITTDYILDETATLFQSRGLNHLVSHLFDSVLTSKACSIVWIDQERFLKTRSFFLKPTDHAWSFTDCTSFIIMKEMHLSFSLTSDRHFKEAGFIPMLIK